MWQSKCKITIKITMTPSAKIEYVKRKINEQTQISPKGPVHIELLTLTEYEEGPTIVSHNEQRQIVRKLEEELELYGEED